MQIQIKTFIFKNHLWCFWSIEKFQFLYDHLRFVYGCKYVIIHSHTSYVVLVSSDFARATKQPNMRLSDSFLVVDRIVTNKHVINMLSIISKIISARPIRGFEFWWKLEFHLLNGFMLFQFGDQIGHWFRNRFCFCSRMIFYYICNVSTIYSVNLQGTT